MSAEQQSEIAEAEAPPEARGLTHYDLTHLKVYLRLFDAVSAGEDRNEIARALFGRERAADPPRVDRAINAHFQRALWMARVGYAQLLRRGRPYD